jgi:Arc/MetJ family transcription regulator
MRVTVTLDDELVKTAQELTGVMGKSALVCLEPVINFPTRES